MSPVDCPQVEEPVVPVATPVRRAPEVTPDPPILRGRELFDPSAIRMQVEAILRPVGIVADLEDGKVYIRGANGCSGLVSKWLSDQGFRWWQKEDGLVTKASDRPSSKSTQSAD